MTKQLEHDYQSLTSGAGYTQLNNHGLIRLTGEDRLSFFHNFCTNDIKDLETGQACEAFILNSKGKILNFVHAINLPDELLLYSNGTNVEPTIAHLDMFLIREDVAIEDATTKWTGLFISGEKSEECLAKLGVELPEKNRFQRSQCQHFGILLGNLEVAGFGYLLLTCESQLSSLESALAAAGIAKCSQEALQVTRIENATPWNELDVSENNLPQELQRDSKAINFNKGCYLGQETVARIDARGRVNRLLVSIRFSETSPTGLSPTVGHVLTQDGQPVGNVSSVAFSFRDQCHLGMGFVKRAFKDPETELDDCVVIR